MDAYEMSLRIRGVMNFFSCSRDMAEKIIFAAERNGELKSLEKMCGQFEPERSFIK